MIDQNEIEKAFGVVITTSGLFPRIVWSDRDLIQERPYIAVTIVPGVTDDRTIGRSKPFWSGFASITAVTALDEYETAGRSLLKQVGDLFPAGTRLAMPGGDLLVPDHPQPIPGYRDKTDFRSVMRINLTTEI